MAENSAIEWTDATWNPVRGCTKISAGCQNCYARTFAERWRGIPGHPYELGFCLRRHVLGRLRPRHVGLGADLEGDGAQVGEQSAVGQVAEVVLQHHGVRHIGDGVAAEQEAQGDDAAARFALELRCLAAEFPGCRLLYGVEKNLQRRHQFVANTIAARMDEPNYGSTVVYRFPADSTIFGPAQIEARIDQDAAISQQISLWNQSGSSVIRGNLITGICGGDCANIYNYGQSVTLTQVAATPRKSRRVRSLTCRS